MSAYPNVKFLLSANAPRQFPPDSGAEVAVAGRSNAGKSSALNAIAGRKGLARTSKTPGATRLINFFELEPGHRIVDLPGYGFAAVPGEMRRHWGSLIDAYFRSRRALRGVVIVMDARHPLTEHDRAMLALARGSGARVHLLLTKADKLGRGAALQTLKAAQHEVRDEATAQLFSAVDGTGIKEARGAVHALFQGRSIGVPKKETPVGPAEPTGEGQPGVGG
jgi:GTP-binding protein